MHAWQTGDYQTSFTLLQKLSAKDDGHNYDSQEYLALHYLNGQGTAQSYHKGLYWMERAILQGDDVYLDYFRALQDSIKRIEKNLRQISPQALELFNAEQYPALITLVQERALQNDANSQYLMGEFCEYGDGIKGVSNNGIYWYQKAADQHQVDAQYTLGRCYENGLWQAEKDLDKAAEWYEKAARQNDARAQCRLGYLIGGEDQEGDMEKAVYWIKKSAVQNDAEGQYYLGECYEFGTGIVQDINKACEYYEKAGTQGIAEAWTALGLIHAENATTGEDKEKARMYYQKAIALGNIAAGTYLWALIKK